MYSCMNRLPQHYPQGSSPIAANKLTQQSGGIVEIVRVQSVVAPQVPLDGEAALPLVVEQLTR